MHESLMKWVQAASFALLAHQAIAGEVTVPNSFVSGTPARATEVNANFNAVKSAVDDNHNRISTLESGAVTSVGASAPLVSSGGKTPNLSLGACSAGQVLKHNGTAWACAADADSNSGGTVTSVTAGAGLTGGTITGSGTIAIDPAYRLPQSCGNGQVAKSDGAGNWSCAGDNEAAGWNLAGNTGTNPASQYLGTSDDTALELRANNSRVMRYEPNSVSPNLIGGSPANNVTAGARGATIAGGGVASGDTDPNFFSETPNRVTDVYGTVGGGYANRAGDDAGTVIDAPFATVAGGDRNTASGHASAVAGGYANTASGYMSAVAGGEFNTASGQSSAVAGGQSNTASDWYSAIAGGSSNTASAYGSAVAGGSNNTASGSYGTVAGGYNNTASGEYSFAAGRNARTETADATPVPHDGAFVWADSNNFDFRSSAANELAARATGGVRFVTSIDGSGNPTKTLNIEPDGDLNVQGNVTASGFTGNASTSSALAVNGNNCPAGQYPLGVDAQGNAESCTAAGAGTVTSVASGTGLTGGGSGGSVSLAIATGGVDTTQLANGAVTFAKMNQNGCGTNQIAKWNGTAWACAADADSNSGGTVTSLTAGAGLTGGTITGSGTIAVDPASTTLTGAFHKQGGNAYGATAVLGSSDNNVVEIDANNGRVMRYEPNSVSPNLIGGSPANNVTAGARGATIAGGGVASGDTDPLFVNEAPNRVTDVFGTVGGGYANRAGDDDGDVTDATFATVAGGQSNTASGSVSAVAGGLFNTASGGSSAVAGGQSNTASGNISTVAGGRVNTASGDYSTVAGGYVNTASGNNSTVAGGRLNTASGDYSTVAGGYVNTASGNYSFAAGRSARTETDDATPVPHDGAFVWADSTGSAFHSTASNQFSARASGGVRFLTNSAGTTGVYLTAGGGGWASVSDRAAKRDLVPVDGRAVLAKVAALPLAEWSYKTEADGVRHMGPMAQDFRAAFGLGTNDKTITTIDADGVALAAIQGLARIVEEKDAEIAALKARLAAVERTQRDELVALRQGLAELRADLAVARDPVPTLALRVAR